MGGPGRVLGDAFRLLGNSIEQDLRIETENQPSDYCPLVFLLTDGVPTDNFRNQLNRIKNLRGSRKPTIVALGCGSDVDVNILHEITDNVFLMQNLNPVTLRQFFRWISGSVAIQPRPNISSREPSSRMSGITYHPN